MSSVKIHRAVRGVPAVDVSVASDFTTGGAWQVAIFAKIDGDTVTSIALSPNEARELAERLIVAASQK